MLEYGWFQSVHPEDQATCLSRWHDSLNAGENYEMEFRLRRHDGVYRWFLDRAVALRNPDGNIAAWIGTSTDIDDRKAAEAAMADANTLLEQRVAERAAELDRIFKISSDILTVGTFERRFISVSPAWERITGHPVREALERSYLEFIHPEDLSPTLEMLEKLKIGQSISVVNRFRRADGGWCWLSWRAVASPEQQLIYSVARDITTEREREEQLRQSQKMEVVGQLTGGVAHDFNNLLTIIMGSLELLQNGLAGAEPRLIRRAEAAMEGARRAAALTHRLLAFSRRQPLEPKLVDVNRLLSGMSDMLHRTLDETIAVKLVCAAGLWSTMADANQLENAILNLAVNARDAMPGGGNLCIETQNTYLDESYATNADIETGQYVMVAVSDTGVGMTPDIRSKVFEPFFTTKPPGQGTGLGLAQVYGFIKQSGGHCSIYSEPGEGTTVKIYLPRLAGTPDFPGVPTLSTAAPQQGQGQTVLVVEDEPGVRSFSTEVLADLGYHVLSAESGHDALRLCEAKPAIHLLFTDVVLGGGLNGRQLAEEIGRVHPGIIVLFTTGYTRNAIVHHGRLDEGVHFIGKPFTAAALAAKVTKLLEKTDSV
jgi:PAS domain S-box-containing protein